MAENSLGRARAATSIRVWGARDVCGCVRDEGGRVRRITEGSEVTSPEQYPWQVLIEYKYRHSDKLCGGTLLRPDWLLTAAHCLHAGHRWLQPRDLRVRVGVVNRSATFEPSQQLLAVNYILAHPEYNTSFQHLVNKVHVVNPRRACARVTVVVLSVCLSVCVSVYSRSSCFSVL